MKIDDLLWMDEEELADSIITLKQNNMKNFNINLVSNIQVEGIDMNDYPDFCDAFIVGADYNGVEMTEEQVIQFEEDYPDYCYEAIAQATQF